MASSVIRELEELRALLDTPKKTFSPLKTLKELSTPRADAVRSYSTALNGAEKSVDRLGRAIEAAEEEMDAALKRTTEIHRSQLKQKELELLELQRVIGAKDRSLDSLRDTLATTKRTYESKLAQSDSALALKDAEVGNPWVHKRPLGQVLWSKGRWLREGGGGGGTWQEPDTYLSPLTPCCCA